MSQDRDSTAFVYSSLDGLVLAILTQSANDIRPDRIVNGPGKYSSLV